MSLKLFLNLSSIMLSKHHLLYRGDFNINPSHSTLYTIKNSPLAVPERAYIVGSTRISVVGHILRLCFLFPYSTSNIAP